MYHTERLPMRQSQATFEVQMRHRGMRTGVTWVAMRNEIAALLFLAPEDMSAMLLFFGLPKLRGRVPLRRPRRKTKVVTVAGEDILRSLDVSTTPAPATPRGRRSTEEMALSCFLLLPFHDDGDGM